MPTKYMSTATLNIYVSQEPKTGKFSTFKTASLIFSLIQRLQTKSTSIDRMKHKLSPETNIPKACTNATMEN